MGINRIATGGGEGFGPPDDGSGHSAGHPHPEEAARHADGAEVSALASALGALQQLQQEDPARFRQVLAGVSAALRGQACGAPARALQLERLAARLDQAAREGDLAPVRLPAEGEAVGDRPPHALQAYRSQPPWPGATMGAAEPPFELARLIQAALRDVAGP